MQRVFRSPSNLFDGVVTIDVNDGQYSNFVYHNQFGPHVSARQQKYTHNHLAEIITRYVRVGWWVEDIDPDLIVAEGL